MIELETIPDEYRTDHLLLLVGANPLPNYVAARLLTKPGSTVHLLHTVATKDVADALSDVVEKYCQGATIQLGQVDTADSTQIYKKAQEIERSIQRNASIGFNYTGGTKAMSVHVYRALEEANRRVIFSYLDAQTLSMRFDSSGGEPTRSIYVRQKCEVHLDELAQLHGYIRFQKQPVHTIHTADKEKILNVLLEIHLTDESFSQWRQYSESRFEQIPTRTEFPALAPIIAVIEELCGVDATAQDFARLLGTKDRLKSYSKWLIGEWLEEYVLMQVETLSAELPIHDCAMSIEPAQRGVSKNRFELDVAAMIGYQLFAASCKVEIPAKKAASKQHLFEAYVRARQLGGDEARVCLVCFHTDAAQLEEELQETWLAQDVIRVFGRDQLRDLKLYLRDWFESANLS